MTSGDELLFVAWDPQDTDSDTTPLTENFDDGGILALCFWAAWWEI